MTTSVIKIKSNKLIIIRIHSLEICLGVFKLSSYSKLVYLK